MLTMIAIAIPLALSLLLCWVWCQYRDISDTIRRCKDAGSRPVPPPWGLDLTDDTDTE